MKKNDQLLLSQDQMQRKGEQGRRQPSIRVQISPTRWPSMVLQSSHLIAGNPLLHSGRRPTPGLRRLRHASGTVVVSDKQKFLPWR